MTVRDIDDNDHATYTVVVNLEEQYSIWPASRDLPAGWERVGFDGTRADCRSYIDRVWTDMRPKSLREHMQHSES